MALGDAPLHPVLVRDHPGHARPVLLVDARRPQIVGLVGVAVCRDHEVLPRIAGAGTARPARVSWRREPPLVGLVDHDVDGRHGVLLHWTSVNGGVASSCGSNTASTGAPIWTSCLGSPSRLPSMRTPP